MSFFDSIRYRLRVLSRPRTHETELAEEVDFHVGLETMQREHAAHGEMTHDAARSAARRRFGNKTYYQEESRRVSGLAFFDVLAQDVRFALRSFRRTPTFTAVVVATLAIGIGANTAIFSAVNALLLRPLPFTDPDRLVSLSITAPPRRGSPAREDILWSYPKFTLLRDAPTGFADVAYWFGSQFTLTVGNEAVRESGEFVDSHYLTTLGVMPAFGRNFVPAEDRPGAPRAIMISDDLWQGAFNADPQVLGKTIDVDGTPFTVIGVLPRGFHGLSGDVRFWIPVAAAPGTWPSYFTEPNNHTLFVIGRLAPGMSLDRANAIVQQIGARVDAAYPRPGAAGLHLGATVRSLDATRVDPESRRLLFILLGAVALVLLIACANVANLFLVRASGRRREIAVRLAIGAGRWRLVRQLLVEGVLLSVLGGVASLGIALAAVRALSTLSLGALLRLQSTAGLGTDAISTVRLDIPAFLFTGALAVATGLLFGLVPALQATRPTLTEALKDDGSPLRVRGRAVNSRNVLTIVEITLAVVLLAGSGLMLRSLAHVLDVQPGFDADNVLTLRVNRAPGWSRDSITKFYDVAVDRLSGIPGVTAAAIADCPPVNGGVCSGTHMALLDRPRGPREMDPAVGVHWITPAWPAVVHMPLLRGRLFTNADTKHSPKVVLVSQLAARSLWRGQDPVGKALLLESETDTAYVVGVVGDVHYDDMESPPRPDIYVSYYQAPLSFRMMLFLRTRGDPRAAVDATRRALREVAPGFPMYDVATLNERVGRVTAYARFSALLLGLFALIALALAMMGTYGVISFAVAQRTREMGVRLALGATGRDVIALVVRQGIVLAAIGATIGVATALMTSRLLRSLLYGVEPTDPVTLVGIVAILLAAVVAASWIPARRAAGVPAVEALRGG
jgi:predicted permease